MDEGDRHFQRDDSVFKTLRKIAARLDSIGVPYAIAGGMALQAHGFRRLTVDVDILVNREGLKRDPRETRGAWVCPALLGQQEPAGRRARRSHRILDRR